MHNKDQDVVDILSDLPKVPADAYYWARGKANARIGVTEDGKYLQIWPSDGGMLSVNIEALAGDIAPFSD